MINDLDNSQVPSRNSGPFTSEQSEQIVRNIAKEHEHSFEFAKAALSAKTTDKDAEREHHRQTQKTNLIFISIITLIITGLIAYALSIGKDNFAMELIKAVIFILSGGAGGFAIGKSSHKDTGKDNKPRSREDT